MCPLEAAAWSSSLRHGPLPDSSANRKRHHHYSQLQQRFMNGPLYKQIYGLVFSISLTQASHLHRHLIHSIVIKPTHILQTIHTLHAVGHVIIPTSLTKMSVPKNCSLLTVWMSVRMCIQWRSYHSLLFSIWDPLQTKVWRHTTGLRHQYGLLRRHETYVAEFQMLIKMLFWSQAQYLLT